MNLLDALILALVAVAVALAVWKLVRDKKCGKGTCGCGCANCTMKCSNRK